MWVVMVEHKTSYQYLTSGRVSTRSIHGFKRYRLLNTLTKNFNILSNADEDGVVTALALPVFSYRQAEKRDRSLACNYRPVSLTCVPCKLPEHIVCSNIIAHLYEHKLLSDRQHAF